MKLPRPIPPELAPPFKPRRGLLRVTCALLVLWIAFLLVLYFTVVR